MLNFVLSKFMNPFSYISLFNKKTPSKELHIFIYIDFLNVKISPVDRHSILMYVFTGSTDAFTQNNVLLLILAQARISSNKITIANQTIVANSFAQVRVRINKNDFLLTVKCCRMPILNKMEIANWHRFTFCVFKLVSHKLLQKMPTNTQCEFRNIKKSSLWLKMRKNYLEMKDKTVLKIQENSLSCSTTICCM